MGSGGDLGMAEIQEINGSPKGCKEDRSSTSGGSQHLIRAQGTPLAGGDMVAWSGNERSSKGVTFVSPEPKHELTEQQFSPGRDDALLAATQESMDDDYGFQVPLLLDLYMRLTLACLRLTCHKWFQNFITFVIILASVMVGIQTYPALDDNAALKIVDKMILYIFTVECVLKILAVGLRPWEYVYDAGEGLNFWNIFDFAVVLVCYLPLDASMVTVIRLFRLLRVLKLVRTLPELQILVMGLLGSVPSIFYVALMLCLVYYFYSVMCLSFFKKNDPVNFHDLQTTFLTLFRMSTLDDWVDIMYSQMYGNDIYPCDNYRSDRCTTPTRQPWLASLFFVSFIVLSAFVVLNLFIGVVATQMEEAKDRLTKENENRGNMTGCEDEFDEDERSAKLIALRYDDLIKECEVIQEEAKEVTDQLLQLDARMRRRHHNVGRFRGVVKMAWAFRRNSTDRVLHTDAIQDVLNDEHDASESDAATHGAKASPQDGERRGRHEGSSAVLGDRVSEAQHKVAACTEEVENLVQRLSDVSRNASQD